MPRDLPHNKQLNSTSPQEGIGPIYLGELNRQFIDSAKYIVIEDIYLDTQGSCVIIRSTEPCEMKVHQNVYNNYMEELHRIMPKQKFTAPNFQAGHRFLPSFLMKYSAYTFNGKKLNITENKKFGTTILDVNLPLEIKAKNENVLFKLPGYYIVVEFSRLAQKLDKFWFLQWSHGSVGNTKLYLRVNLPNLRKNIFNKIINSQFFLSEPDFQKLEMSSSFKNNIKKFFPNKIQGRENNNSKMITGNIFSKHERRLAKSDAFNVLKLNDIRYQYVWERSLGKFDTMSIHVAYGQSMRRLFSPIGFLISNIIVIILTIILTDPLTKIVSILLQGIVNFLSSSG